MLQASVSTPADEVVTPETATAEQEAEDAPAAPATEDVPAAEDAAAAAESGAGAGEGVDEQGEAPAATGTGEGEEMAEGADGGAGAVPPADGEAEMNEEGGGSEPAEAQAMEGEQQAAEAEAEAGAGPATADNEEVGDASAEASASHEVGEAAEAQAEVGEETALTGAGQGPSDEAADAATKIQSVARGKQAKARVQRIKMGEEDPFAEGGEKAKRDKRTADGSASDGQGAGDTSLEQSMEGVGAQSEGGELDISGVDDTEARAAAELKAREEKQRLEAEARQARINEQLELSNKYQAAMDKRKALVEANAELQKKLAAHLAAKQQDAAAAAPAEDPNAEVSQGDLETRYFQSLRQVADNRAELEKVQLTYDHMALDMKTRLEQKQEKARELEEAYGTLKKGVALGTSGAGTGRLIPVKLLNQLEEQAAEKEAELEKVRLKNIHLRNQLRKLEGNLKRKEELSNELHLIDFEQLKIENQTLNEKIEERNEELLKLRKKTTTTVQVLTHLKEKLQFVQAENQLLKVELAEMEAELSRHRDSLTRAKHDRDSLRNENLRLRGEAGLIGNNDLLRDFDRRKKEIASMQVTLEGLKTRHRTLRQQVVDISAKTIANY